MFHTSGSRTHMEDNPTASHMPLDTELHWKLRNPLNIFPALVIFSFVVAIISLILF